LALGRAPMAVALISGYSVAQSSADQHDPDQ
jgi:hypothetical protein